MTQQLCQVESFLQVRPSNIVESLCHFDRISDIESSQFAQQQLNQGDVNALEIKQNNHPTAYCPLKKKSFPLSNNGLTICVCVRACGVRMWFVCLCKPVCGVCSGCGCCTCESGRGRHAVSTSIILQSSHNNTIHYSLIMQINLTFLLCGQFWRQWRSRSQYWNCWVHWSRFDSFGYC